LNKVKIPLNWYIQKIFFSALRNDTPFHFAISQILEFKSSLSGLINKYKFALNTLLLDSDGMLPCSIFRPVCSNVEHFMDISKAFAGENPMRCSLIAKANSPNMRGVLRSRGCIWWHRVVEKATGKTMVPVIASL
jgi:hypothetical protein